MVPERLGASPDNADHALRILLVDDDIDVREIIQGVLEDDGYEVMVATDGSDALQRLPLLPVADLIILDLQMPRLSGVGFMTQVAQHSSWTAVPILVVSGDPEGERKAKSGGASGYLVKPVRLNEFSAVVARMCGNA